MSKVQRFEDLSIFQMARDLTKEVYAITKDGEFRTSERRVELAPTIPSEEEVDECQGGNAKRNMAYSEHARRVSNYEPLTGAMKTGDRFHRGNPLR